MALKYRLRRYMYVRSECNASPSTQQQHRARDESAHPTLYTKTTLTLSALLQTTRLLSTLHVYTDDMKLLHTGFGLPYNYSLLKADLWPYSSVAHVQAVQRILKNRAAAQSVRRSASRQMASFSGNTHGEQHACTRGVHTTKHEASHGCPAGARRWRGRARGEEHSAHGSERTGACIGALGRR